MLRARFRSPLSPEAAAFGSSVEEDAVLLAYDVLGSLAHVRMLVRQGLVPGAEGAHMIRALQKIQRMASEGKFELDPSLEDVHMNVESTLTRWLGSPGSRLPTGRSRNDQVALDLALYLRHSLLGLESRVLDVVRALLERSRGKEGRLVIPAATHMQDAQRVYLAQVLQAHAHRFLRDVIRLRSVRERSVNSPLGAGAVAGSSLPLDPAYTARLLGFRAHTPNSMDAVSDRDTAVETLSALALLGVHMSSLAEEWIVWSTPQFGRLRLDDRFVTTSSLMPHKRNPDMAELLRAEAGPLIGLVHAHLTLLKGLPLAYNRDLQAGKPLLFDGVRRADRALRVLAPMVRTASFIDTPAQSSPTASVELADSLVRSGVPFREAHARVAKYVAALERRHRAFSEVGREEWSTTFPELGEDGWHPPAPREEPELRVTLGGSSWGEVVKDSRILARELARYSASLTRETRKWDAMVRRLQSAGR